MADFDEKALELMRKRFKRCLDDPSEQDNRKRALEAIKFRALEQWPARVKQEREMDAEGSRPCLVMDEINQYLNQVKNDYRQNRPGIKARPVDDKGDKEVAEAFQGLIRHIEDVSNADIAYDNAFDNALDGGFGYFRVITDYCDDDTFDQEIKICGIKNRFAVYLDPSRQLPDGSDAEFGFITEWLSKEEFKRLYPNASDKSWTEGEEGEEDWTKEDDIRLAEYFYVEYQSRTLIALPDGEIAYKDEWPKDLEVPKELKTRDVQVRKVCWVKTNGIEAIDKRDWLGKWIPIVECIGNEIDIEGKSKKSGIVEGAMDPQRMHNYSVSSFVEQVALAPRAPYIAAEGQLSGHEGDWKTANRRNLSVLQYKPNHDESGSLLPAPQRQPPPGIPPGWAAIVEGSRGWVQSSMGMYNASLGAPSNEKSGKAILARQREGDTATFHFPDNMAKSIRHCGRILVDLIPKIYDTKRVVRLLAEDGAESYAVFDPGMETPKTERQLTDGTIQKMYNPTVGKYDVTISVGPSYTTKRQEGAEMMTQVLQGNKEMMALIGDIYFRILDVPYGDKIADRIKAMLPPQIQQMEAEGENSEEKMQMVIQTLQGQLQQAEMAMQGLQEGVAKKEQELQQAEESLNGQAAKIKEELLKLQSAKQLLDEHVKRIEAEIELKQMRAEKAVSDAVSNAEQSQEETQPEKVEAKQQPVTVMDSSLSGPMDGIGQGMAMLAQSVQQTNQVLAQTAEINAQQTQFLAQLMQTIAKQSGPKRITLPDGSVATTEFLQ